MEFITLITHKNGWLFRRKAGTLGQGGLGILWIQISDTRNVEAGGLWGRMADSFTEKYIMIAYMMLVGLGRFK